MDATAEKFHSYKAAKVGIQLNDTHTRNLYQIFEAIIQEDTCRGAGPHLSVENQQPAWTQVNTATVIK